MITNEVSNDSGRLLGNSAAAVSDRRREGFQKVFLTVCVMKMTSLESHDVILAICQKKFG